MQKTDFRLTYGPHDFHGIRMGKGPALLVCLHGFGETAAHFLPLAEALGQRFTLVAIDLPLHGTTRWRGKGPFTHDDLRKILELLLHQEGSTRFSVMGYSLGGRVALCAVECMAECIDQVILVAPDGLYKNPWHTFVTQTMVGNCILHDQAKHPQLFFSILHLGRWLRLINKSVYNFAYHSMDTMEKRLQVYDVWTTLRRMWPDLQGVAAQMQRRNIPLLQVFGQYDRVIRPTLAKRFAGAPFRVKTLVLEKGHQLINTSLGYTIETNL